MEPDGKDECNDLYCAKPAPAHQAIELVAPNASDASRSKAYDIILNSSMLVNREGQQFSPSAHLKGKHLMLYFSAHWCPPCRNFTPKLAQAYENLKASGKQVDIVFISSDKGPAQFQEYLNLMPWLALPFEAPERTSLGSELGVNGIPCLILFSPEGHLINREGVMAASLDPMGKAFPWVGELSEMSGGMKAAACMACLCCPCICAVGIVVGILRCVFCVPCLCPPEQPGQPKK